MWADKLINPTTARVWVRYARPSMEIVVYGDIVSPEGFKAVVVANTPQRCCLTACSTIHSAITVFDHHYVDFLAEDN